MGCCGFDVCYFGLLLITTEELIGVILLSVKPRARSLTDDFTRTTVSRAGQACFISHHYVYAHIGIFTVFVFLTLFKDDRGVVQGKVGTFIFFFILLVIIRSYDFFLFFKFANVSQLIVIVCCVVVLVCHVSVAIPTAIPILPVRSTHSTFAP